MESMNPPVLANCNARRARHRGAPANGLYWDLMGRMFAVQTRLGGVGEKLEACSSSKAFAEAMLLQGCRCIGRYRMGI